MNIKTIMLALISLMVVLGAIKYYNTDAKDSVKVEALVNDGALLVDVRTPEEFAGGSVPGAINIPLGQVESRITEFKDKGDIVVFCRSGNRSGQALKILESNGITTAVNGGSWQNVNELLKK